MLRVATVLTGIAFVAAMFFLPGPEEKRVALVIGNEAYVYSKPKNSAASDSRIISDALKKRGFDVVQGANLNRNKLQNHIRKFARMAKNADAALLYYSGKMVQLNGRNYLSPIDAGLWSNTDVEFHTVPLDPLLSEMRLRARTSLLFFDACREKPHVRRASKKTPNRRHSSAPCRGIAPIDNKNKMVISYSMRPGAKLPAHQEKYSPFAIAFAKHIHTRNAGLDAVMANVRQDVVAKTSQQQIPWEDVTLQQQFVFNAASEEKTDQPVRPADLEDEKVAAAAKEIENKSGPQLPTATKTKPVQKVLANFRGQSSFDFRQHSQKSTTVPAPKKIKPAAISENKNLAKAPKKIAKTERVNRSKVSGGEITIDRIGHNSKDLQQIARVDLESPVNTAPEAIKKKISNTDLASQLQEKLAQLGCFKGKIDGIWGRQSKQALRWFSYRTNEVLPSPKPTSELIELVAEYSGPVCSVSCARGVRVTKTGECSLEVAHSDETENTPNAGQKVDKKKRAYKYKSRKSLAKKKRKVRKKSRAAKRKRAKRRRAAKRRYYYNRRRPRAYYVRGGVIVVY